MMYKLRCKTCQATCWAEGDEDSDTHTRLIDRWKWDWNGGKSSTCEHEEYSIVGRAIRNDGDTDYA